MEKGLRSELENGEGSRSTINEGGLHETRKDQIIVKNVSFADQIQKYVEVEVPEDSDYGISSFGDVASSEGTIIEETQEGIRKEEAELSHRNSSLETDKEEEWVMKGPRKFVKGPVEEDLVQVYGTKLKGWNRMKKTSDGEDSDKEDMIEDKWAETLLGNNKQIDNNYLEEDIEFMSDGDNMEMTDDEARQAYEATSESNDEYVSNSEESENEIFSDQNSLNHHDGNVGWCGHLFNEEDKALGISNNVVMDKQEIVGLNQQLVIHTKENGHPTTSFRFGCSFGLLFTIISGDIRADLCISKRAGAKFQEHQNKQREILVDGSRGAEKIEDRNVRVREIFTEEDQDGAKIPIRNEEGAKASKSPVEIYSEVSTPIQGLAMAARESGNSERWFGLSEVDKEKFCEILEEMGITMYATKGKEKKYAKRYKSIGNINTSQFEKK
ncbi:hypothetical protein LguiA_002102 [Lonicera macranthoides]